MPKIDHNSVNLHQIPTKIGVEMHFNKPFVCINFQLDQSMRSCFMGKNAECAKCKKKMKKNYFEILLLCISGSFLQIWLPSLGASQQQVWLNLGKRS